jgi:hypothetical protein
VKLGDESVVRLVATPVFGVIAVPVSVPVVAGAAAPVPSEVVGGSLLNTLKLELLPEPLPKTGDDPPEEPSDEPDPLLPELVLSLDCPHAASLQPKPAATMASQ